MSDKTHCGCKFPPDCVSVMITQNVQCSKCKYEFEAMVEQLKTETRCGKATCPLCKTEMDVPLTTGGVG